MSSTPERPAAAKAVNDRIAHAGKWTYPCLLADNKSKTNLAEMVTAVAETIPPPTSRKSGLKNSGRPDELQEKNRKAIIRFEISDSRTQRRTEDVQ